MVDPENITDYNLSNDELEERLLFWVTAAGKNGRVAARNLDKLLKKAREITAGDTVSPFRAVGTVPDLPVLMKNCGIGCHSIKAKTFLDLSVSGLCLRTCTAEDLERIYGIGMKTSRCFILHSRENAQYAGLDTHILKYLRASGVPGVPYSTPSSKKMYLMLERAFLQLSDAAGVAPAVLDLEVWNSYSKKEVNYDTKM